MDSQLFVGKPQLGCHEPLLTDLPGSDPKAYQNFLRRVLLNFLRWCYRISLIRRHQLEESWGPIYERSPTAVARATDIRDLSWIGPLATSPMAHPVQTVMCCIMHSVFYGKCPAYLTNIVRTVTAACSRFGLRSTSSSNLLSLSYGRDSATVPSHKLGPQRGTLCLQTSVLSGTGKRSDKPSKLTILVWRLVYFNGFIFYLHFIYVTIGMHLCSICNRRTTNVRYGVIKQGSWRGQGRERSRWRPWG